MPIKKTTIKSKSLPKKTKIQKKKNAVEPIEEIKKIEEPIVKKKQDSKSKEDVGIKKTKIEDTKSNQYYEAIGRRKTSVARIRLWTRGDKEFSVNGKPYKKYFQTADLQQSAVASLQKMKCLDRFKIIVKVKGGGMTGQAEAIRHGTARILIQFNSDFQKRLRKVGYLTRDSRMRERKKFGLKRARRAPQWQKR